MSANRLRRAGSHLLLALRPLTYGCRKHTMLAPETRSFREIEARAVGCLRPPRNGGPAPLTRASGCMFMRAVDNSDQAHFYARLRVRMQDNYSPQRNLIRVLDTCVLSYFRERNVWEVRACLRLQAAGLNCPSAAPPRPSDGLSVVVEGMAV